MTTSTTSQAIDLNRTALGIELGSTRIKAVLVAQDGSVLASGGHTWDNQLVDGIWTYSLQAIETGLQEACARLGADLKDRHGLALTTTGAIGVSGMMHGYLALDDQGRLLAPFRTWRNTMTGRSVQALSELFPKF